jgi:serine/threonine-protein kinase SRPK3
MIVPPRGVLSAADAAQSTAQNGTNHAPQTVPGGRTASTADSGTTSGSTLTKNQKKALKKKARKKAAKAAASGAVEDEDAEIMSGDEAESKQPFSKNESSAEIQIGSLVQGGGERVQGRDQAKNQDHQHTNLVASISLAPVDVNLEPEASEARDIAHLGEQVQGRVESADVAEGEPPTQPSAKKVIVQPGLSEEQLKTAACKLVDFGNACWVHKQFTTDIQTRQYRYV